MGLDKNVINGYARSRKETYKGILCHAPFVNLNFEQNGNVRACCYNNDHILGQWPTQSIKEIWQGKSADILRGYIKAQSLDGGCSTCGKMIAAGNYQGVRARYYDEFAPNSLTTRFNYFNHSLTGTLPYPKVMEFELSNECNLECIMCSGYFSSSIRKNREHLPPIGSPYNDKFVDELEEFIPHLTDAKFLGGEPFMIEIYLKIWERIRKINPNILIHITTNGTFLNNRIKDLLEGLNAGIILSIDSIVAETYRTIRVNGNLDKVMENLEYFIGYVSRKGTFLSIATCPMTVNWKELPGLRDFCLQRNIILYLNAVFNPEELSLHSQSPEYLAEVISFLKSNPSPAAKGKAQSPHNITVNTYNDFINMLEGWQKESSDREASKEVKAEMRPAEDIIFGESTETVPWSKEEVAKSIISRSKLECLGYEDKDRKLQAYMASLYMATPAGKVQELLTCYLEWFEKNHKENVTEAALPKVIWAANAIENHPMRKQILFQISRSSPEKFVRGMLDRGIDELKNEMQKSFT